MTKIWSAKTTKSSSNACHSHIQSLSLNSKDSALDYKKIEVKIRRKKKEFAKRPSSGAEVYTQEAKSRQLKCVIYLKS